MSGYWAAFVRCIQHVLKSGYALTSFCLTAIGAMKDVGGFEDIPFSAWVWWFGALGCLFVLAVRLQFRLDAQEEGSIRRLRLKKYVTFHEIALTLRDAHTAYSIDDIFFQLAKAIMRREFEEYSGHSRLHITHHDAHGHMEPARPIVDGVAFLNSAGGLGPRNENVEWALFEAAIRKGASVYGALTLEQRVFARWYRRFRHGRYEN